MNMTREYVEITDKKESARLRRCGIRPFCVLPGRGARFWKKEVEAVRNKPREEHLWRRMAEAGYQGYLHKNRRNKE
jgi:hypothetical protein